MECYNVNLEKDVKLTMDSIIDKIAETTNDPVTRNSAELAATDISELYKYVNSIQMEIYRHTNIFMETWTMVSNLIEKIVKLDEIRQSTCELSCRILMLEEKDKKLRDVVTKVHVKANDNKSRIKKINDVSSSIESIEEKLKVLQGEIEQYKWEYESDKKKMTNTDYAITNSYLSHVNHNNFRLPYTDIMGNVTMKPPRKDVEYRGMKVNCDYLILF